VYLYILLALKFPFSRSEDREKGDKTRELQKTLQRILAVDYAMPHSISAQAQDLIRRIFVADPSQRITIQQMKVGGQDQARHRSRV
jgi:hypothetical protein